MKILLTGGTGFIGRPLVKSLVNAGHTARVLSRRLTHPPGWPEGVALLHWDGPGQPFPSGTFDGIEGVINLAGESIGGGRWTESRKDRIFASRIGTTRALADQIAAAVAKPKVMISASAVGYYGPHGDEEITEAMPPGSDFLATVCSHWEEEAKAVVRYGVRLALIRTGVVLGKEGGALPRMMMPFRFGAGGPVGTGRQYVSWIHRDDLIGLILFILQNDRLSGPINATAPNPVTNREFARTLGMVMRRPGVIPTPGFVLRLMLGEMADLVLKGQRVLPKRAEESGFVFRRPNLDGALHAILSRRK